MWRKFLLSIGLIMILIAGIEIFYVSKKNKEENKSDIVRNETELSGEYVTDDCVNEWEDYSQTIQNEIKETSGSLNDENRHYILREKDNIINIYYINEKGEEILYRVTEISTKYLGDDDVRELKEGIEVVGVQQLNQLLEDFE